MRNNLCLWASLLCLTIVSSPASATLSGAPEMVITTTGIHLNVAWSEVTGATGYNFYYAPYPYNGEQIGVIDAGNITSVDANLWEGAAFYLAIQPYDELKSPGDVSNIDFFVMGPPDPEWIDDDGDGYHENNGDCDDTNASIHVDAEEVCGDAIDQDCDDVADENCSSGNAFDQDGDGVMGLFGPDCNDNDATVYPGAVEICEDGIDQDCDGTDEACTADPNDVDDDNDGFTENQGDCIDSESDIYPGATEVCGDGVDQDCDGTDLSCDSPGSEVLLSEVTLGVNGGSLVDGDFSMNIPPGTLSGDTVLGLYSDTEKHPLGDPGTLYRVKGIPSDYSGPLSVRMTGSWIDDDSFIIVGEQVFASSTAGITEGFHLIDGSREGDFLVVDIPAADTNAGVARKANSSDNVKVIPRSQQTDTELSFGIFRVKTLTSTQGHFRIIYPANEQSKAVSLAVYLEEAYSTFSAMGFSYSDRTRWPVDVTLTPMDIEGAYSHSLFGNNYGSIKIDSQLTIKELRTTAGHEFFHLVQYLYDPRSIASKAWSTPSHFWFNEATATWIEEKFSNAGYVPPNMELNRMAPFDGMHQEVGGDSTAEYVEGHGYGMASLIKYIAQTYGDNAIRDIYLNISTGYPYDIVSEIEKQLDPVDYNQTALTWWWKYLRELIFGSVYPGLYDPNFLSSYVHDEWTPTTVWLAPTADGPQRTVTSTSYSRSFQDYSGGLYIVNLANNNFTNRSYFNVLLTPHAKGEGMEFYRFKAKSSIDLSSWIDMEVCWPGFDCDRGIDSSELVGLETQGENILVLLVKSKTDPSSTASPSRTINMEFQESGYWNCGVPHPKPAACY